MLTRKLLLSVGTFAILALIVPAAATSQELNTNQRTFFTFSAPVQLPGVTLPAGKYQFQLATSLANRHIVQVFNADGSKILATILANAAQRNDVPNEPEVRFFETPADVTPAIQTWWFPGTRSGHEFIYSKQAALLLAKTNKSVLTTEGELRTGELERVSATGVTKVTEEEWAAQIAGSKSLHGEIAAPARTMARTEPAPAPEVAGTRAPRKALPHTASGLPLVALVGILSLASGVALVSRRRRLGA
jgi:LPXTG-motif cell wall-anchored protein